MLSEHLCDIKERKLILIARFNKNFVNNTVFPKMEKDIVKVRQMISNKEELVVFNNSVSSVKLNHNMDSCIYALNMYAYADIPLGKEYDVIGFMDEHFRIIENTVIECKTRIVSCLSADYKYIPMDFINHGHNAICAINFLDGVPEILNSLYEINEPKSIRYEKIVFLSTYETLNANGQYLIK